MHIVAIPYQHVHHNLCSCCWWHFLISSFISFSGVGEGSAAAHLHYEWVRAGNGPN